MGAAEGTLQYILDGIGSLGGITDDLIKAKINMIDNSLLRIAAKLGVDLFSEVSEEELQNYLEPAFRSIIFGEAYDAPTVDEMVETAIVTAGTTLLLGGGDTVNNDLRENGPLNATVQMANNQANAPVNQEEVAKSLRSKGISSKKATGIAEAIVARLNGQELTRTQRELLSFELGSPTVQSVISELIKKKANGIDSAQHNVYDEISTIGGNAVTEGLSLRQDQNAPSEGSSGGGNKTIFNSTPELEAHIRNIDPSVPRKRGVGGAHNSKEFFKNGVEIASETPSKIPGVKTVEYRMPKLNADGTPTGEYGSRVFRKTIYDPDVISDNEFMRRGLEAANDAISKADDGVMPREWSGVDSEGITWHGYCDENGKITSFYPEE